MKYFDWDNNKNEWLKKERQVSFEEVIYYIESGGLLNRELHPNQEKYEGQEIFIVKVNDYVFLVPFIENEEKVFLKTIIPSRKATKNYLRKDSAP